MHPAVKSVECDDDYVLSVSFDNGENGLLDMKPYLDFGVFRKIKNPNILRKSPASLRSDERPTCRNPCSTSPECVFHFTEIRTIPPAAASDLLSRS